MPLLLEGTWLVHLGLATSSFGVLHVREVAHVCGFYESSCSFETLVLTILR